MNSSSSSSTRHFRRCHVCGCVNEHDVPLSGARNGLQCHGCGKHLAPFYFFEESGRDGVSDTALEMSLRKEAVGYQPLWGFSAIW